MSATRNSTPSPPLTEAAPQLELRGLSLSHERAKRVQVPLLVGIAIDGNVPSESIGAVESGLDEVVNDVCKRCPHTPVVFLLQTCRDFERLARHLSSTFDAVVLSIAEAMSSWADRRPASESSEPDGDQMELGASVAAFLAEHSQTLITVSCKDQSPAANSSLDQL